VIVGAAVDRDLVRRADVVVIGSGAGGAVTASRLAEAGYQVVVLESGPYMTRADFTEDEASLTERLYADGALRTHPTTCHFALLQGQTVGGSSTINWMIMLRTPEYVLDEWSRDYGIYGMQPREMLPVFERIERELQSREVPTDAHSANNPAGARQRACTGLAGERGAHQRRSLCPLWHVRNWLPT
jgi:choline dehydrogenase-like flavoprotein